MAGDLGDMDAVKNWHQRALFPVKDCFHVTRFPPHRFTLQQIVS